MTGGTKQTQSDALADRVRQDMDPHALTYAEYEANELGNGRRLVGVPINSGFPNYQFVQVGAFFLSIADDYEAAKGNEPFCAEYVGAWVKGSSHKGVRESGGFEAKLVR
jgi:hypothetical protein